MRSKKNRDTFELDDSQYSPELIRQYEDPEFARLSDQYERSARRGRTGSKHYQMAEDEESQSLEDFEEMLAAQYGIEENSKKEQKIQHKKNRKKYRMNKFKLVRNIIIFIILLVLLITGMFFFLTRGFEAQDTTPDQFDITPEVATELKDYRNILILGSDARADEPIESSRTDAIIVMSINKKNNDVKLVSVMRDSYLKMEYGNDFILDKITHAHAYGGPVSTAASLNRSLDLNITEYVVFNWQAVADTVDCLGGIKVNVKKNEIHDMNKYGKETARNVGGTYTRITEPGVQTLDGVQATTYCRIRKTSGGDSGRTARYKKVLAGVMKKAVVHPLKLSEIAETISPNIRTNMKQKDMFTAGIRAPFFDMKNGMTWPKDYYAGYLSDGISYVVPITLDSNVRRLHEKVFDQPGYQLSTVAQEINEWIINDTGIY